MVEKRENEIDTLKGIGILFVIASHCDANLRLFFSYPFSFTMPLFFWVAGYFLTNRTSFPVFVGKKFNRLMLPYWLWCVLSADVFFIHNPFAYFPIPAELWRMFLLSSSLLWMPPVLNIPLWFFPALFAVLLLLYPCVGWSGKKLGWSMAALFVLTPVWQSFISREWIFSCRIFPPALFFGLGGIYAARNKTFLIKRAECADDVDFTGVGVRIGVRTLGGYFRCVVAVVLYGGGFVDFGLVRRRDAVGLPFVAIRGTTFVDFAGMPCACFASRQSAFVRLYEQRGGHFGFNR